jgi:hypothetical protein
MKFLENVSTNPTFGPAKIAVGFARRSSAQLRSELRRTEFSVKLRNLIHAKKSGAFAHLSAS